VHVVPVKTVLVLACIVCLASVGAREARPAAKQGLIAFTRYRLQDKPIWSEIWVAQPDGSRARKVSHSAKPVEDDGSQWSPGGDLIAFQRCPPNDAPCSVWIVRPDGSGERAVAVCTGTSDCNYSNPSFTHDGKHLVFVHDWGHVKQGAIPDDDQIDHSPDGARLLFSEYAWNPKRITPDVLSVAPFGGGAEHRVVPRGMQALSGSWSPDGKTVLFRPSHPTLGELTPGSNLYTVALDGTNLHRVTDVGPYHYVIAGSFSPDGRSIVFATDDGATLNPLGNTFADIFTLRLGSARARQVTHSANLDGWPAWG
jgi:Tol biopolymer transport system component